MARLASMLLAVIAIAGCGDGGSGERERTGPWTGSHEAREDERTATPADDGSQPIAPPDAGTARGHGADEADR